MAGSSIGGRMTNAQWIGLVTAIYDASHLLVAAGACIAFALGFLGGKQR